MRKLILFVWCLLPVGAAAYHYGPGQERLRSDDAASASERARDAATRARAQISSSLRLLGQHGHPDHAHHDEQIWHPQVIQLSALKGEGVDRFWDTVSQFRTLQTANQRLTLRRQQQSRAWMWERIDAGLKQRFRAHPLVKSRLDEAVRQVLAGELPPSTPARQLLELFD